MAVTAPLVRTDEQAERWLHYAAVFFTVAVLFHNSDHLRRGASTLSLDVFVAGSLAIFLEVGVVALIFMRHRLAPLAAVATGFPLAAGYVFVHFTPDRGWLSDSFVSEHVSVVSRVAASGEVAAALAIGLAGWYALRHRGLEVAVNGPPAQRSFRDVVRHPAVAAMIIGNAIIFTVTLATF